MNLYVLTQDEVSGPDTYDACIVAAEDVESARLITPGWAGFTGRQWASRPENVRVELVGVAAAGVKRGVLMESYTSAFAP